jgi:NAD(P)-dependent dehydrogenase (short-subunit alcohol dehydrogenase family)
MVQTRGVPFEEIITEARSRIPMGDFTLPEDVAAVVSFLSSNDARHITGTKLIVDGGIVNCDTYEDISRRNTAARYPALTPTEST